jgi:RNA polymerase sigma-70 factor (ECF subfamily)
MTDPFLTHRSLLFTVAYEMLGSAADAEDVVQESWLRWAQVDQSEVNDARAYLVRIVTRQALNRLRTLARRREHYVGEWLPEPLLTTPDVAEDVELAESVSMAMLTVLETLTPTERAVFVLREVFDMPYDEIAAAVDKTAAAVRQTARRAREHVAARRPRMQVDRSEQQRVVERFLAALTSGDVQALMEVLAPEVVVVADGGGLVPAARHPVVGADKVVAFLSKFSTLAPAAVVDTLWLNGALGGRVVLDGELDTVMSFVVEGSRISHVLAVRNPHKLGRLDEEAVLAR